MRKSKNFKRREIKTGKTVRLKRVRKFTKGKESGE